MIKKNIKILSWIFLIGFVCISCGKDSNPISINIPDDGGDPPVNDPDPIVVSFSSEQAAYQPGELIQFKVSNTVLTEEVYNFIGNDSVSFEMASFTDSLGGQYLLYLVRELPPDSYAIKFDSIGSESILTINIDEYEIIAEPDNYIKNVSSEVINEIDNILSESIEPEFYDSLSAVRNRLQEQLDRLDELSSDDQQLLASIINQIVDARSQNKSKIISVDPLNCPDAKTVYWDKIRETVKLAVVLGSATYVTALANPLVGIIAGTFSVALLHQDLKILWDMTWSFIDLCVVPELSILNPLSKTSNDAIIFNEFDKRTFRYDRGYSLDKGFKTLLDEFQKLLDDVQEYVPISLGNVPDESELDLNRPFDLGSDLIGFSVSVQSTPTRGNYRYPIREYEHEFTDSLITLSWTFGKDPDPLRDEDYVFLFNLYAEYPDERILLQEHVEAILRIPDYRFPEEITFDAATNQTLYDTIFVEHVRPTCCDPEPEAGTFNYSVTDEGYLAFEYLSKYESTDQPFTIKWRDKYLRQIDGQTTFGETDVTINTLADELPVAEGDIKWRRGNKVYNSFTGELFYKPIYDKLEIPNAGGYEVLIPPSFGEFEFYSGPQGSYKFTPDPEFAGFDSVVYRVNNSQGSDEETLIFDMYNVPLLESDIVGEWKFYVGSYQNSPFSGGVPECSQRETQNPFELIAFDPFTLNDPVYIEFSEAHQLATFNEDGTVLFQATDCAGNIIEEFNYEWFINGDEQGIIDENPEDGDRDNLFWLQYGNTRFPVRKASNELNITFRESNTFIKMVKQE